jgi:hypothetical protein
MPALEDANSRRGASEPGSTSGTCAPGVGVGAYLTDEVFLYRVVSIVADDVDEIVELEDCFRLDIVRVQASSLRARRLRVVLATWM